MPICCYSTPLVVGSAVVTSVLAASVVTTVGALVLFPNVKKQLCVCLYMCLASRVVRFRFCPAVEELINYLRLGNMT